MHLPMIKSFLIIIVIGHITCEKLSEDDNFKRLGKCGTQEIPIDEGKTVGNATELKHSSNYWIVKVKSEKGIVETPSATGFFISERHILTSSQSIFTMEKPPRWGYNGQTIDDDYVSQGKPLCSGVQNFLKVVPKEALDKMNVILGEDCESQSCTIEPASAHLIGLDKEYDYHKLGAILLIELKDNQDDIQYPCLGVSGPTYSEGEELSTFSFNHKTEKTEVLEHRFVNVTDHLKGVDGRWVTTKSYESMDDRGGPLVKVIDEKVTVIGLGANTGPIPAEHWKYYFDLGVNRNEICAISGVCPEERTTESEETTTTSASTLETTDSTSENDSTTPSVFSNPSQKPMLSQNKTTEKPNRSIDEYAVAEEDIKVNEYVAETHISAVKTNFGRLKNPSLLCVYISFFCMMNHFL